jgi:hypothetical protein
MKTYIAILVGVVVLVAVVFVGYKFTSKSSLADAQSQAMMRTAKVTGEVKRMFEGEHVINYSFNVPELASTTVDMDGALVKIVTEKGANANVYFSYEGGRGFSPADYLTEKVAPHVPVINDAGMSTVGNYEWTMAESAGSEWFVAPTMDKQWLIVVEAKKTVHDETLELLKSMNVQ